MARDLFHAAVKSALLKEDCIITADPLRIKIDGVKLEIDLAADKVVAAEKQGRNDVHRSAVEPDSSGHHVLRAGAGMASVVAKTVRVAVDFGPLILDSFENH